MTHPSDPFRQRRIKEMNRRLKRNSRPDGFTVFFICSFIFTALLSLAILAGCVWVVYELVTWITSK